MIEGKHSGYAPTLAYSVDISRVSDGKAIVILYSKPLDIQGPA